MLQVTEICDKTHNYSAADLETRLYCAKEGLLNAVRTLSKSDQDSFAAYAAPLIESAIEGFIASPDRIQPVPVHRRHP
jgi:DNA-directed RNA polymerase specialized sigma subunit